MDAREHNIHDHLGKVSSFQNLTKKTVLEISKY